MARIRQIITGTVKIAISGSAGIGKTTLARALAGHCGWCLIEEGYDGLFGPDAEFLRSRTQLRREIVGILERKNSLEDEADAFVADRSAVDLFNLWMSRGLGDDEKTTAWLYRRCRRYSAKYDLVFVPPWSAIPLRQLARPARRRRAMNPWFQLYSHATVIGLLHQWLPATRLVPIPFALNEQDARVDFAIEALRKRGQAHGDC